MILPHSCLSKGANLIFFLYRDVLLLRIGNHITLIWESYCRRFFRPFWTLILTLLEREKIVWERVPPPPRSFGCIALVVLFYIRRTYTRCSIKYVLDSCLILCLVRSSPVQLAHLRGLDRIGFDSFVFDELVFLLSLFYCGRFSRHGLSISGFSVSGQAVFGSSSHGWLVYGE